MKIWIIKIGEPLEYDYSDVRLLRASILAKEFSNRGHSVNFFVDKFDHFRKIYRKVENYKNSDSLKYHFLNGCEYKKNYSISRFINHFQVGIQFYIKASKQKDLPDFVIISYPTIFLSFFASIFCSRKKIPYLIDIRDAWPSIFSRNPIIKNILHFYYFPILNYIFKNAFHITGCTPDFQNIPKKYTKTVVKFTYIPHTFPTILNQNSIISDQSKNSIVYFGAISKQRKLDEFLEIFCDLHLSINFVICGDGDNFKYLKNKYNKSNIIWMGQVNQKVMFEIAANSIFGIAPYELHEGYRENIPNKIVEYLSYGLPVITNINNSIIQDLNRDVKSVFVYRSKIDLVTILNSYKSNDSYEKIRNIYNNNFSVESFINKFHNIIKV